MYHHFTGNVCTHWGDTYLQSSTTDMLFSYCFLTRSQMIKANFIYSKVYNKYYSKYSFFYVYLPNSGKKYIRYSILMKKNGL